MTTKCHLDKNHVNNLTDSLITLIFVNLSSEWGLAILPRRLDDLALLVMFRVNNLVKTSHNCAFTKSNCRLTFLTRVKLFLNSYIVHAIIKIL